MNFRTDIDRSISRMVEKGGFLSFLTCQLASLGFTLTHHDKRYFQREFLLIANSHKRPYQEKLNVIDGMISDTIQSIEKMVEFMNQTERRITENRKTDMPPCLTSKKIKFQKPPLTKNTPPKKNPLEEINWIRDIKGRPLAFYQKEGDRIVLYGVGSKGKLGWYNPSLKMTFTVQGKPVGFGNLLTLLLCSKKNPPHKGRILC